MRRQSIIFAAVVILFAGGAVLFALIQPRTQPTPIAQLPVITSFEACAAAGNPIMESYPRQCRTADGKTFIEQLVATTTEPVATTTAPVTDQSDKITVTAPLPDTKVVSPLKVMGEARGNWYFEASFPVQLVDNSGNVIAQTPAQAQSDWMTENFVPFTATLTWSATSTTATSGVLILKRDNPSGLPQNDASVRIPVSF